MSEKSAWEKYKENNKDVKPWDLFNPNTEYVDNILAKERLEICKSCPEFTKFTSQCKKCGCFMKIKTTMAQATCPLNKW